MRFRFAALVLVITLLGLTALGCGQIGTPASPPELQSLSGASLEDSSSHKCLGLWEFRIDPLAESVDVVPLRACDTHLNALAFMEPPAGVALAIDQIVDFSPGLITLDIALTHPYTGMNFAAAFDVSGILISHGGTYFPLSDTLYYPSEGNVRLVNPDGYTRWWNPVEFPPNPAKPQFGYIDGLLGKKQSEAAFDATLNGYKYFATDLTDPEAPLSDLDTAMRGAFVPGSKCVRRYQIAFAPSNLIFNYAVDASWAPAEPVSPPIEIPDDFPPSANRPEAYRIELQNVNNTLIYHSGSGSAEGMLSMSVYVFDWYNPGGNKVCAYAQHDELMGMCMPIPAEVGDGYAVYGFDLPPMMLMSSDDILLWIGVECELYGYQDTLPGQIQGVYFPQTIPVAED